MSHLTMLVGDLLRLVPYSEALNLRPELLLHKFSIFPCAFSIWQPRPLDQIVGEFTSTFFSCETKEQIYVTG